MSTVNSNEMESLSIQSVRGKKETVRSKASNAVRLGFVNLKEKDHTRPQRDEEYKIISASSDILGDIEFPDTQLRTLDIDLFEFYCKDMPDWGSNEGMLKVNVDTRNPQDINDKEKLASFVTNFDVEDGEYAPGFLYRGLFRNILIGDWANIGFDLYELDEDSVVYYEKVEAVLNNVPEIRNLDMFQAIPYIDVATKLFDGIIRTFGKNPDDHVWGEIPILEVNPIIGGAFLRSGIYIITESESEQIFENLVFKNGRLKAINGIEKSNHLIFGLRLKPFLNN